MSPHCQLSQALKLVSHNIGRTGGAGLVVGERETKKGAGGGEGAGAGGGEDGAGREGGVAGGGGDGGTEVAVDLKIKSSGFSVQLLLD